MYYMCEDNVRQFQKQKKVRIYTPYQVSKHPSVHPRTPERQGQGMWCMNTLQVEENSEAS